MHISTYNALPAKDRQIVLGKHHVRIFIGGHESWVEVEFPSARERLPAAYRRICRQLGLEKKRIR